MQKEGVRVIRWMAVPLALLITGAPAQTRNPWPAGDGPSLILYSGNIVTLDKNSDTVQALPEADNALLMLEHASDDALRAAHDSHRGIRQAAIRLHEIQLHAGQLARHLVDIAAQDRRQVSIHHRRVATWNHPQQRADRVAGRNLGEPRLPRQHQREKPPRARQATRVRRQDPPCSRLHRKHLRSDFAVRDTATAADDPRPRPMRTNVTLMMGGAQQRSAP